MRKGEFFGPMVSGGCANRLAASLCGRKICHFSANACGDYIRAKLCVKEYKKIDIDFLIH